MLVGALVAVLGLAAACTVQKSKSALESRRQKSSPERLSEGAPPAVRWAVEEGTAGKTDYLTPPAAVRNPSVFVSKERRRLYLVNDGVLVRDYPVGLGVNPRGDKERADDGRTPEGDYVICEKAVAPSGLKTMALNYPTRANAERALFAGLITRGECRDILNSLTRDGLPSWNTALGGRVLIRGGGAHGDWTDGGIALYDSDLEELFKVARLGTPVHIRP
jgi:hypothetical protein